MSHSSSSHHHHGYRNGHNGYQHYQRRGFLGEIIHAIASSSDNHHCHPGQYPPVPPQGNPIHQGSVCLRCNAQVPVGARFCSMCGEKIYGGLFCSVCGGNLSPNVKFCSKCGNKVTP